MSEDRIYRILWIDDDIDAIQYFLHPLIKRNCILEKVAHLPEAYDILGRDRRFDLIVLDVLMSTKNRYGETPDWLKPEHSNGANGIKLLIQIREKLAIKTPVLILSVVPDAIEEIGLNDKYNPVEFVHKSSNQIQAAIDKILEILAKKEGE